MGGSHCAIVGCGTNRKHRGLSFHQIPKETAGDSTNNQWRRQLIHSVNRSDRGFNPATATICSRHFDDVCFNPHGMFI